MTCPKCEVRADLEGRSVHVRLLWSGLKEVARNVERACILYKCSYCNAFWESCGYDRAARELSQKEAAVLYPALKELIAKQLLYCYNCNRSIVNKRIVRLVNMSPTKTIISKALNLKPAEKSLLIEALLRSLDIADPKIEKIWAVEAEKRLKAYKAGKIKTVSFEDMFAQ